MENNKEIVKLEFLLKLNKNIICQRYFNVKNFNPKALSSHLLHEVMNDIKVSIKEGLKQKSLDYLYTNFNSYSNFVKLPQNEDNSENNDFTMSILLGNKEVYTTKFRGKDYPPNVRFTVDIRPEIPRYLSELTDTLSSKKIVPYYIEYGL
tara:strand:+ start:62009 stop:62458 length:450 start_codon:yes stop_codon:yes gene_type:complete